jgi:hypothetical protein
MKRKVMNLNKGLIGRKKRKIILIIKESLHNSGNLNTTRYNTPPSHRQGLKIKKHGG